MKKFRQAASSLETVKKSIEYTKILDRERYKRDVREFIRSCIELVAIGVVCLLLAILF